MDMRSMRATPEQLSTLLEFMEKHGDLSRPSDGASGRLRSDRLWSKLTSILNSVRDGGSKTTDKWKKVWADWKSKTKKKGLAIRHHTRRTGDGPATRITLSAIEVRVLALMGALRVEGQTSVKELGFIKPQSPEQGDPLTEDHTLNWEIVYEVSHLSSAPSSQPSTSQPSSSWHLPSTAVPPSPQAPLSPPSPQAPLSPPSPQAPLSPPSPQAPAVPTPPTPAAPTTPRRRRRLPAPPPSARRGLWLRSPKTPQSTVSPGRPRFRALRRSQAPNPFERAAREFTAVESRRLELEETRLRHQHEWKLRALEIEHERNEVYRSLINVVRDWLDRHRSRDNSEVKCEH